MPYASRAELPPQVKNLPEHAQSIWRKAFNSALQQYEDDEARAFKIAWAAVKNAGYSKGDDDEWGKDSAHPYEVVERLVFDAKTDLKRTGEGYLVAHPRVARTGVQTYRGFELGRDDMEHVRVYRPDTEVFANGAFRSFTHRPVTIEHPPVLVDSSNWKKYAVGYTGDEVVRDGQFVRVPLMLLDSKAIDEVNSGRSELSAGYTMSLDWTPGKAPTGEAYDAIQQSIRINHVAITKSARGGNLLRIGDGYLGEAFEPKGAGKMNTTTIMIGDKRVTVEDDAAPIILRHLKDQDENSSSKEDRIRALEAELARLKGETEDSAGKLRGKDSEIANHLTVIATKDAEIATLRQQLIDAQLTPQKLDMVVKERAEIIDKARKLMGDKVVVDGRTTADIMRQAVDSRLGSVAKDWKDDAIRVSFDTLSVEAQRPDALADALSRRKVGVSFANDSTREARDAAFEERCRDLESAWKKPIAAQQH